MIRLKTTLAESPFLFTAPIRPYLLSCSPSISAQPMHNEFQAIQSDSSKIMYLPSGLVSAFVCVPVCFNITSLLCGCDRKHAGVVSAQRHGPGGSGVQGHRQRLPQSHHGLHVSLCMHDRFTCLRNGGSCSPSL